MCRRGHVPPSSARRDHTSSSLAHPSILHLKSHASHVMRAATPIKASSPVGIPIAMQFANEAVEVP